MSASNHIRIEPIHEEVPAQPRTYVGIALSVIGALLSVLFLLNLSAGFLEIPDNLPLVGNIDEVAATVLLVSCLQYVGIDILKSKKKD